MNLHDQTEELKATLSAIIPISAGVVAALTDSSGGAAANGTIGAVTAPTALTDNGGGTADATVASMAAATTLTDSTGDSETHNDTLADGLTTTAFTADNGGATADGTVEAMTGLGTAVVLTNMEDGSADNTLEAVGDTSGSDQSGPIERNFDKIGDEVNTLITLTGALANNVQECVDKIQTVTTDLGVQNQNDSDLAQKIIELVTWQTAVQNNFKEITTAQAANRLAIVALTDAVTELATKTNAILTSLKTANLMATA